MDLADRNRVLARYAAYASEFDAVRERRDKTRGTSREPREWPVTHLPRAHGNKLSKREQEVLELMSDGLSNPEIARRLVTSTHTAISHTRKVIAKLEATSRAHAVAVGFRRGLIV